MHHAADRRAIRIVRQDLVSQAKKTNASGFQLRGLSSGFALQHTELMRLRRSKFLNRSPGDPGNGIDHAFDLLDLFEQTAPDQNGSPAGLHVHLEI